MNRYGTHKKTMKTIHCLLLTSGLLLSACGQNNEAKSTAPTQVVAQVNNSEISVHQLNQLLAQAKDIPAERLAEAQRRMLQTLIDQELLMAKALEEKLDRSPEVLLALEAARREVLSRAYLEAIANKVEKPSDQEISNYYDLNPNLFALRNVFEYRELLLPLQTPDFAAVAEKLKASKTLDQAAALLTGMSVKFTTNKGVRAAEQTPADLLTKLSYAKPGEILAVENNLGLSMVEITKIDKASIDLETAKPIITNLLINQRRNQAMNSAVGDLRKAAKITYLDSKLKPQ